MPAASLNYFILTGATGVGKSDMGLRLAREFSLPILSLDSMQVYRGMDIGTAKPSAAERGEVRHYLMDEVDPAVDFDVAQFLRQADDLSMRHGGRMLAVGGSPFYIQALRCGLQGIECHTGYEKILQTMESAQLLRWLQRLDPQRAKKIHGNDRFRLIRALEIILSSGARASERRPLQKVRGSCQVRLVALNLPRSIMHERLKTRIEQMFAAGLLDEALELYDAGRLGRNAAQAVGYKELFAHFAGTCSLEEAREKILVATRRLLKHQMTWLRKLPVQWIDVDVHHPETAYGELRELLEVYLETLA